LWRGEFGNVQHAIARLKSAAAPADSPPNVEEAQLCATAITALHAVQGKLSDAHTAVAALDSAVWSGENVEVPRVGPRVQQSRARHIMLLARLHEIRGDARDALRTIRRRFQFFSFPYGELLAASLRQEGRVAALTGDRAGAIKAYRWYLTLVTDPEPALVPRRDHIRVELARLESGR
jgi:hypothetical protein